MAVVRYRSQPTTRDDPALMLRVAQASHATIARPVPQPVSLPVLEGAIPMSLRGVLFRNGPGRQHRGGHEYGHPFDGDGFVQRFEFRGGSVGYRARYVETDEWRAEEAADRVLYRGFGTNRPGGVSANAMRMRFKNAANTSVVWHGGKLLALWEGGLPHAIDPVTLETQGRENLGGALLNQFSSMDRMMMPELPFAAHPKLDPETGELWNFGSMFGSTNRLLVWRVSPTGKARLDRTVTTDGVPFVHDMVMTKSWAVWVLPPTHFDIPRAVMGVATPVESLTLVDGPGTAVLVPRQGGPAIQIPVPAGFVFHWAHAKESSEGRVTLYGIKYDKFPELSPKKTAASFGPQGNPTLLGTLVRLEIDPTKGLAWESRMGERVMELPCSSEDGFWSVSAPLSRPQPFLSELIKVSVGSRQPFVEQCRDLYPCLPGEPLMVGDWLAVQVFTPARTTELWVLEPNTLETVARIGLPHPVPAGLHGSWVENM